MDQEVRNMLLLCEALQEALIIADRVDGVLAEQITTAFDRADTLCQIAMRRVPSHDRPSDKPPVVDLRSSDVDAPNAAPPQDKIVARRWRPEEDRWLRELHVAGVAVPKMAVLFDREESAIRRRLSTLGLMTRRIARSGAHVARRSSRRSV